MAGNTKEWITVAMAAKWIGKTRQWVHKLIASGTVKAKKVSTRKVLVQQVSLERYFVALVESQAIAAGKTRSEASKAAWYATQNWPITRTGHIATAPDSMRLGEGGDNRYSNGGHPGRRTPADSVRAQALASEIARRGGSQVTRWAELTRCVGRLTANDASRLVNRIIKDCMASNRVGDDATAQGLQSVLERLDPRFDHSRLVPKRRPKQVKPPETTAQPTGAPQQIPW